MDWTQVSHIAGKFFIVWANRQGTNLHQNNSRLIIDLNAKMSNYKTSKRKQIKICKIWILVMNFEIQHQKHNPWKKKLNFIKIKNFDSVKETLLSLKRMSN